MLNLNGRVVLLSLITMIFMLVFSRLPLSFDALLELSGFLLVAVILFSWWPWNKPEPEQGGSEDDTDDLTSLGILDIRPVQRSDAQAEGAPSADDADQGAPTEQAASTEQAAATSPGHPNGAAASERAATGQATDRPTARPAGAQPASAPAAASTSDVSEEEAAYLAEVEAEMVDGVSKPIPLGARPAPKRAPGHHPEEHPAVEATAIQKVPGLQACLYAIWSATGGQTICLLAQDSVAPRYRIQAIVSQNGYARTSGNFPTSAPLLTAEMLRQPITSRSVRDTDLAARDLRYYRVSIAVREIVMVPITVPDKDETFILLADTLEVGGLSSARQQQVLLHGASLLSTLLTPEDRLEPIPSGQAADDASLRLQPRREIIQEEMESARAASKDLALALVYVNKAEEMAASGTAAIEALETTMRGELVALSPDCRVERFGELMFGVFHYTPVETVAQWATDIQAFYTGEAALLGGGVSIGVAVLKEQHERSDELRQDATMALREAFEHGDGCVILE